MLLFLALMAKHIALHQRGRKALGMFVERLPQSVRDDLTDYADALAARNCAEKHSFPQQAKR